MNDRLPWQDAPSDFESDDYSAGFASTEITEETGRWNARDVIYTAGRWKALSRIIPRFSTEAFQVSPDLPPNPYLRTVVRAPLTPAERPIPVGVVSNTYHLAQHAEVVEKCFEGLRDRNIDPEGMWCEVGLSPLGEWMNFRCYLPPCWSYRGRDEEGVHLRLECFNSVDGSSRLVILLGWFRFVCSNGLVIGDTKAEVRRIHDARLDLRHVPGIIADGLESAKAGINQLHSWEAQEADPVTLRTWVDGKLASAWGKKAACRVWHICGSGTDVKILGSLAHESPSKVATEPICDVPGAAKPARSLYDLSQALSWVATRRSDLDERLEWQVQIADLVESLPKAKPAAAQPGIRQRHDPSSGE